MTFYAPLPRCFVSGGPDEVREMGIRLTRGSSHGLLLIGIGLSVLVASPPNRGAAPDAEASVRSLMEQLLSDSAPEPDQLVLALAERGEAALPLLEECLRHDELAWRCAEVLTRMPPELSGPVLVKSIRQHETVPHRTYPKALLVGALGRLKWREALPFLEEQYELEKDPTLSVGLAWALETITGIEYGPSEDPWFMYK